MKNNMSILNSCNIDKCFNITNYLINICIDILLCVTRGEFFTLEFTYKVLKLIFYKRFYYVKFTRILIRFNIPFYKIVIKITLAIKKMFINLTS
jgi:hypothetical protein